MSTITLPRPARGTLLQHGQCNGGHLFVSLFTDDLLCTGCDEPPAWSDVLPYLEQGEHLVGTVADGRSFMTVVETVDIVNTDC